MIMSILSAMMYERCARIPKQIARTDLCSEQPSQQSFMPAACAVKPSSREHTDLKLNP